MRELALVLACASLAACGPSRRAWEPPPMPVGAAGPAAFAVIRLSTPLSIAPDRDAPTVWGISPAAIYGGASQPSFAVVRVRGQHGSWVAVETLGEPAAAHCVPEVAGLTSLRLRLFVPASALVPVTQREVAQSFGDGTRIELARGAPLEALPQRGMHRVQLGALRTILRLEPADVGTRYLPSPPREAPPSRRALSGDVLAAGVPILGHTGRVEASVPREQPVHGEEGRGSEALAELRLRCGRLVVRVPSSALVDAAPSDLLVGVEGEAAGPQVSAGTPIRWRDGREAGVVTRTLRLQGEAASVGSLRCFAHALRPASSSDPRPELELCFERHAIEELGVGRARRLDSPRQAR